MSEQRRGPGLGHGRRTPRPPLPEHLRQRRWMLGLSSPVVLVLLLVASLLLGVTFGNLHARAAYTDGRYATAAERFSYQVPFSSGLVEPWKAWFNAGTAEFQAGEHFRSVEDLREAHRLVPPGTTDADGAPDPTTPECRVRTNLSLALEAMGDDAQEAGDPAMAVVHYNEAMDMIGPCTSDGQSESDEQQQDQSQQPPPDPSQDQSQDPSQDQSQDPSDQPSDGQDGSAGPSEEPGQDQSQQPGEDPSQQPGQDQSQQPDQGQQQPDQGQQQPDQGQQPGQQGGGTPDQTEQRQRQKADQAQRDAQGGQGGSSQDQPGGPGQDDPSGGQGPGNEDAPSGGGDEQQQPTDPRQRELEERNRQAERDRQEQEQQRGGGFGGGQNW